MSKDILIAVESSCDDTSVSAIDMDGNIIFEEITNQNDVHAKFGGVVPELAARSHLLNLQTSLNKLIQKSHIEEKSIKCICATGGPGLTGGLIVGLMFAKGFSQKLDIPFIAINHLEGHIFSAKIENKNLKFPFLAVLISGGHCEIIIAHDLGNYEVLGRTLDDAIGEAFDKTARMLKLGYPGGKKIDELAQNGNPNSFKIPIPMERVDTVNMSFSGLKTNVMHLIKNLGDNIEKETLEDVCASVQSTITKALKIRVEKAIKIYKKKEYQKNIIVCGGVASNSSIRNMLDKLAESEGFKLFKPSLKYCTDNATMVAIAGLDRYKNSAFSGIDFSPSSQWSIESQDLKVSKK